MEYNEPPQNPKRTETRSKRIVRFEVTKLEATVHRTRSEPSQETPAIAHEQRAQAKRNKWHST